MLKRSGSVPLLVKVYPAVDETELALHGKEGSEPTPVPPQDLTAIIQTLRQSDPRLAEVSLPLSPDRNGHMWFMESFDGTFLKRDVRRLAEELLKVKVWATIIELTLFDEEESEWGLEIEGYSIKKRDDLQ